MSEKSITHLVKSIADNESATITLTNLEGERICCECLYKESEAPRFFVVFPPLEIAVDIDSSKSCPFVGKDRNGQTLSFSADIVEKTNDRTLELIAKKAIDPADLREYFRVNLTTRITVSFEPESDATGLSPWELSGKVVDISQSGVLTILPEECKNRQSIFIEIDLTEPCKTIYCVGHVVRIRRIKKGRWLTAFHFDDISQRTIDDIAVNCFAEQRRQLRENIRTV